MIATYTSDSVKDSLDFGSIAFEIETDEFASAADGAPHSCPILDDGGR